MERSEPRLHRTGRAAVRDGQRETGEGHCARQVCRTQPHRRPASTRRLAPTPATRGSAPVSVSGTPSPVSGRRTITSPPAHCLMLYLQENIRNNSIIVSVSLHTIAVKELQTGGWVAAWRRIAVWRGPVPAQRRRGAGRYWNRDAVGRSSGRSVAGYTGPPGESAANLVLGRERRVRRHVNVLSSAPGR